MTSKGDFLCAWTTDPQLQKRAESGGAVTALLRFALESGTVDAVLAIKKGMDIYDARPALITNPEEFEDTAGSMHCGTLLISKLFQKYLNGANDMKIAVALKGCDVMGIYEQAKRGLVNLDNLLMIGLNCGGSITPSMAQKMITEKFGVNPGCVIRETIAKGRFFIEHEGIEQGISITELEREGYGRRSNCRRCKIKIPRQADLACGNWGVPPHMFGRATFVEVCSDKGADLIDRAVAARAVSTKEPDTKCLEARRKREDLILNLADEWREKDFEVLRSSRERLRMMIEETSRCIKCYTCVEVCPALFDAKTPYLTSFPGKVPPGLEFHLTRYAHVADSCINCGQCEELCPMDIPNALIMHAIATDLQELYGYDAGQDMSLPAISLLESPLQAKNVRL
jgi:formate dehydrogenase subunit beta